MCDLIDPSYSEIQGTILDFSQPPPLRLASERTAPLLVFLQINTAAMYSRVSEKISNEYTV